MLYIQTNEHSDRAKFVHVAPDKSSVPPNLTAHLQFLDEAYPDIGIEFEVIEGEFSENLIESLSKEWDIPTNLMFIGSPRESTNIDMRKLGEVRLII